MASEVQENRDNMQLVPGDSLFPGLSTFSCHYKWLKVTVNFAFIITLVSIVTWPFIS